ncbi:MAG: hypothetical protein WC349_03625 [Patescibacteria group bacterium]|jgi:lipopolysaccharide export LptBFGC system permease protein LptF
MTPKKATIIILVLFLILLVIFSILYYMNQALILPNTNNGLNDNQAGQLNGNKAVGTTTADMIQQKIDKVVEDAQKDPKATEDTVRQEVISTINTEIINYEQNKTPEQKAADLKAQEERQRIIDEINNQIKEEID